MRDRTVLIVCKFHGRFFWPQTVYARLATRLFIQIGHSLFMGIYPLVRSGLAARFGLMEYPVRERFNENGGSSAPSIVFSYIDGIRVMTAVSPIQKFELFMTLLLFCR